MSQEKITAFYQALASNEEMINEFKNVVKAIKNDDDFAKMLPEFAARYGFDFTFEEFQAYQNRPQQLNDGELDQVNAAGCAVCIILGIGKACLDSFDKLHCKGKGGGNWCYYIGFGVGGSADSEEDDKISRMFK